MYMQKDEQCLFCKIIDGSIPSKKVYEDEKTFAFLDIGPVSKGHYLVIPKNHASCLQEGTVEDASAAMQTVYKTAGVVMKALEATGYNLGLNHGVDAGQEVFHTHFHVMPRYADQPRAFVKLDPADHELAEVQAMIQQAMEEAGLWK
jgi:histidine triad (HIT) family protein